MFGKLLNEAKAAAVEYAENRTAPRGSSSSAAVSAATPAWDSFRNSVSGAAHSLREQVETRPEGGQSDPTQAVAAVTELFRSVGTSALDIVERKVRQSVMPAADPQVLQLSLLAARLSDIAYGTSFSQVEAELARLDRRLELVHFRRQPVQAINLDSPDYGLPQWLLVRQSNGSAVYLIFRGTASTDDVLRNLMAAPKEHGGLRFHGGFLAGVRDDPELRSHLHAHLSESSAHMYIIGHSLGGSLALALTCVTPPAMPPTHAGELTVIAIGSPPVIHGPLEGDDPISVSDETNEEPLRVGVPVTSSAAGTAPGTEVGPGTASSGASGSATAAGGSGSSGASAGSAVPAVPLGVPIGVPILGVVVPPGHSALPRDANRARAIVVVNAADAVPRLLGSPLPLVTSSVLSGIASQAVVQRGEQASSEREDRRAATAALLRSLPAYVHLPQTEIILLRANSGEAIAVPPTERKHVLHLHESLSVNALQHHQTSAYIANLERALRPSVSVGLNR